MARILCCDGHVYGTHHKNAFWSFCVTKSKHSRIGFDWLPGLLRKLGNIQSKGRFDIGLGRGDSVYACSWAKKRATIARLTEFHHKVKAMVGGDEARNTANCPEPVK